MIIMIYFRVSHTERHVLFLHFVWLHLFQTAKHGTARPKLWRKTWRTRSSGWRYKTKVSVRTLWSAFPLFHHLLKLRTGCCPSIFFCEFISGIILSLMVLMVFLHLGEYIHKIFFNVHLSIIFLLEMIQFYIASIQAFSWMVAPVLHVVCLSLHHFCFMFRPSNFFCLYVWSNLHWRSCIRIKPSRILFQTQPGRGYNSDKKWHCSTIHKQKPYSSYILAISIECYGVETCWRWYIFFEFIQAWKKSFL